MMAETIAVTFGMIFVGIILICLVWTVLSYVFNNMEGTGKANKKLLANMKKYDIKK